MRPKTRKYEFVITDEDIATATRADSGHCVIADAIARTIGVGRVAVDLQTITFTDPVRGERLTYLTPPTAQDHLVAFDQGLPVHPFGIVLKKPIQIRAAGGHGGEPARVLRTRERNERLTKLQGKRDHGENMTKAEKSALTRMEQRGEMPVAPKPTVHRDPAIADLPPPSVSEARARVLADESGTQVHGGRPPKAATLSNARGRVRRYGMRQLKPRGTE